MARSVAGDGRTGRGRRGAAGAVALALWATVACDCDRGYRVLQPTAPLVARGGGFETSVVAIEADTSDRRGGAASGGSASSRTGVRLKIRNGTGAPVHVELDRLRLAVIRAPVPAGENGSAAGPDAATAPVPGAAPLTTAGDAAPQVGSPVGGAVAPPQVGSPIGGAVAGAQAGGALSGAVHGGGGALSGGGALLGAGLGLAVAGVVLLPLAIYAAVDRAVAEGRLDLRPSTAATYLVLIDGPLDTGARYALVLDGALALPAGTLPPLPLVDADRPHLGYGAPGSASYVVSVRIDGGPLLRPSRSAGAMGGIELFAGWQVGRFGIGGFGVLGAGAAGVEARYAIPLGRSVSLVPLVGYGYYYLVGGVGFSVGHGPRAGVELNFPVQRSTTFGWDTAATRIGLYAQAGPVFLFDGPDPVGGEFHVGMDIALY